MSNNDNALEMVLSKILKFNKEITTNQKNKKLDKVKKTHKPKKPEMNEKIRAIKKIEDQLRISSAKFIRQKIKSNPIEAVK